jgi:DNA-binding winged helix-turn-helix (wHTH) protein
MSAPAGPPDRSFPRPAVRYRFGEFVVSTARRQLLRSGHEVPLIPRYFDLLVLLLERRNEAVHRREILDRVWSDVVVSDGALSQAVRTLRRTLGDESRDGLFFRTVSRHGYQFAYPDVVEEREGPAADSSVPAVEPAASTAAVPAPANDPLDAALDRLLAPRRSTTGEIDERRAAAEALHTLDTAEALRRLDRRPGHEAARALLRDARWDVPGAGPVPLFGAPGGLKATAILFALRMRRALRLAGRRWEAASVGGALAGTVAGALGGISLLLAGSPAPASVAVVLSLVGAVVGGVGAAGVGAGLAVAEALVRGRRALALITLGGLFGGGVGFVVHHLARWTLEGVFGRDLGEIGGGFEGLALGAAAGLGYALATPRPEGGMATPRGRARLVTAVVTGMSCALAGVALAALGGHLAAVSLSTLGRLFEGSQVQLAPLARLLGEAELGPLTRIVLGAYEGMLFGAGLAFGLTRRPGS